MGYVRTAGMSTAARRARRRAGLVMAGLLAALLLALVVALAFMQGWFGLGEGSDDAAQTTAVEVPVPSMLPEEVSVNVFNATSRGGLAGRTAEALRDRGFDVQGVDNADAIEGVGIVRFGPEAQEQAELLAESLDQEVTLDFVEREGTTVDLILGPDWEDLASDAEPTTGG